jgi:hypothetical protein
MWRCHNCAGYGRLYTAFYAHLVMSVFGKRTNYITFTIKLKTQLLFLGLIQFQCFSTNFRENHMASLEMRKSSKWWYARWMVGGKKITKTSASKSRADDRSLKMMKAIGGIAYRETGFLCC